MLFAPADRRRADEGTSMRPDERPPLQRALETAAGLKAGSWESVEALALLAIEAKGRPECASLLETARAASAGLKPGTWEAVLALACLARAERET
jgi:hypothetical protein